jgi:cytochrome c oxidase assembly factor 6
MAYGLPDWLTGGPSTTSSANPKSPPRSNDGGYIAPDRTKREVCYESRDIFFKCLDKHDILDAVKDDEKSRQSCPEEVTAYERDCARSWVGPLTATVDDAGAVLE